LGVVGAGRVGKLVIFGNFFFDMLGTLPARIMADCPVMASHIYLCFPIFLDSLLL
jgi:hypothetical protein